MCCRMPNRVHNLAPNWSALARGCPMWLAKAVCCDVGQVGCCADHVSEFVDQLLGASPLSDQDEVYEYE
jgi:hypothetical protein